MARLQSFDMYQKGAENAPFRGKNEGNLKGCVVQSVEYQHSKKIAKFRSADPELAFTRFSWHLSPGGARLTALRGTSRWAMRHVVETSVVFRFNLYKAICQEKVLCGGSKRLIRSKKFSNRPCGKSERKEVCTTIEK